MQLLIYLIASRKKYPRLSEEDLPTVSILVAARNEEETIVRCLEALDKLDYPEGKLDIVMINDNSTDNTKELITSFINGKSVFRLFDVPAEKGALRGKTNALAQAVKTVTSEIVLTTDADCAVHPKWAKTIASYYTDKVGMVNGFTPQHVTDGFSGMQHLDFTFLLTIASGSMNLNMPLSCIGNNMSYKKAAYDEVGGYENIPFSVTEDFNLLMAIHKLKKYKILYPYNAEGIVESLPLTDWKSIYRQKKRWGVGGMKSPVRGYFLMFTGFISHLGILASPFFVGLTGVLFIFLKLLFDFLLLFVSLKGLKRLSTLKYFFHFELYYIIYVLLLPIVVLSDQKVIWKGREY